LSYYTDGYIARYYTRAELAGLLERYGLKPRMVGPLGQTSELVPLPGKGVIGRFKYSLVSRLPEESTRWLLRKTGSFLFAIASKQ
jgi:hypothetical protein